MKVGDLVRIKRSSIGCPRDTVGLIVETSRDRHPGTNSIYKVQTFQARMRYRWFTEDYLEVVSAER